MNSGIYTAFSGLRSQMEALDILSNNLANLNTTGFKEDKTFFTLLNSNLNAVEGDALTRTINDQVVVAQGAVNPTDGSLQSTQRDLDVALTGSGFLVVRTPQGLRYTRNGSLALDSKSVLSTPQGYPVMGESGKTISLGPGKLNINEEGDVFLDGARVDRLRIVSFDSPGAIVREGNSLFMAAGNEASQRPGGARVRQGYLEQSNVNAVSSVVGLVGIMRQFEAIQKSVNLVMNDMDAKSIEKLGR